jgi:predicted nucleic acid-binding protein
MIIPDTSVWIEFLKGKEPFLTELGLLLEERQVIALECIFGELLQGAKTRRERKVVTDYWNNLPKIEEQGLWVKAGLHAGEHKLFAKGLGLIDVFILTAAGSISARVWTLDKKMASLLTENMTFHQG